MARLTFTPDQKRERAGESLERVVAYRARLGRLYPRWSTRELTTAATAAMRAERALLDSHARRDLPSAGRP